MKVTIYHKDTGKFLLFGKESNSRIQSALAEGHTKVEGKHGRNTKLQGVSVISDTEVADRRSTRSQELRQATDWLRDTDTLIIGGRLDQDLTEQFFQNIKTIYNP